MNPTISAKPLSPMIVPRGQTFVVCAENLTATREGVLCLFGIVIEFVKVC